MNHARILSRTLALAVIALWLAACGESATDATVAAPARELTWDDLMPADFDPMKGLPDLDVDINALDDSDPRAARYMALVREMWDNAPVVPELDGQRVKIPGFVVPVDYDDKQVSSFLLVPYFGACIHTPPPPSNQIVHVETGGFGPAPEQLWEPVWVTGTLATEAVSSELGEAGYRMQAVSVEPYEEQPAAAQ